MFGEEFSSSDVGCLYQGSHFLVYDLCSLLTTTDTTHKSMIQNDKNVKIYNVNFMYLICNTFIFDPVPTQKVLNINIINNWLLIECMTNYVTIINQIFPLS